MFGFGAPFQYQLPDRDEVAAVVAYIDRIIPFVEEIGGLGFVVVGEIRQVKGDGNGLGLPAFQLSGPGETDQGLLFAWKPSIREADVGLHDLRSHALPDVIDFHFQGNRRLLDFHPPLDGEGSVGEPISERIKGLLAKGVAISVPDVDVLGIFLVIGLPGKVGEALGEGMVLGFLYQVAVNLPEK